MGSDMNPLYLDFWPIISKVWKTYFNITPVLGLICDEDSDFYESEYGIIKKYKRIEGVSEALQSQCVRLHLNTILDGNVVISDIDMLPMSKKYFIEDVTNFDEDKLYVMSSDNGECNNNKEIPMCYNIGNSKTFVEFLNIDSDWNSFINKLHSENEGLPQHMVWTTDQRFLYRNLIGNENFEGRIVFKNRGWGWGGRAEYRIDRIAWNYDESLVNQDYYIDCHLLRPYLDNKIEIDKLVNLLK
jgi:hypothetical protein